MLDQEYPNLEYFVMDGGSTDGSQEIIARYAHRLAGWVSERDRGQADAINKGFSRATGDVVAWINSDDYYLPGSLRAAVEALQANPACGMVFGDVLAVNGEGQPINVMTYGNWDLEDLMQFRIIGQPSVFMRRSVLERAGPLDLSFHYLLDHHLWLRVAQHAPIRYIPQRLSAARYHASAKNVAMAGEFGKEAYRLVDWMAAQPGLADRYSRLRRRIWAGANRIAGFYLLDAGQSGPALRAYLRSLWAYPPTALPEMRRIAFAAASLVFKVDLLRDRYLASRKQRVTAQLKKEKDQPLAGK